MVCALFFYPPLTGINVDNKIIRVQVATPSSQHTEHAKSNVYIAGLPKSYSKADLDSLFGSYGNIVESRVLLGMSVSRL